MGGLVIIPDFFPSTCLRRRRSTHLSTPATTPAGADRATGTRAPAPAEDAQHANTHQTALVAASSALSVLALVLPALLPADRAGFFIKAGLRAVPLYTLSLHLRTALPALSRCTPTPTPALPRLPLSAAWLATAALAAIVWLSTESTARTLALAPAPAACAYVYIALIAGALLEGHLLAVWGAGLFVASLPLPKVRMEVEKAVIESERALEEGAAKNEKELACGRN